MLINDLLKQNQTFFFFVILAYVFQLSKRVEVIIALIRFNNLELTILTSIKILLKTFLIKTKTNYQLPGRGALPTLK